MDILLSLLQVLAVFLVVLIGGSLLVWLLFKLAVGLFGRDAVLRPFDFIDGVADDLGQLAEEWRDIRRERRKREVWRREEDERVAAILAERSRGQQEAESASAAEPRGLGMSEEKERDEQGKSAR